VRRGGEDGHGDADLGDEFLSGAPAHAGDLIESVHRRRERGDQLLHLGVEMCDVDVEGVDAPQHRGADEGVMVFEMARGRVRWFVYVIDFRVEEYTRDHD
jgi:hypothetical protein